MKITDIKSHVIMPIPGLAWLFVEFETDDGVTRLGECTDYAVNSHLVRGLEAIKPLIVGSDPKNIEEIWKRMIQPGRGRPRSKRSGQENRSRHSHGVI